MRWEYISDGKMRGNGKKTVDGMTCVYSGVHAAKKRRLV